MTNAEKLDQFLKNLPQIKYSNTLLALSDYLEVSWFVLYHYRKGTTHMRKSTLNDIEKFFNEKIF